MKIYTKTGDKGQTSLFGGGRVMKNNARIEAYGTVDELNATIGLVLSLKPTPETANRLQTIQNTLFILGSDLATPPESRALVERIKSAESEQLENWIDEMEGSLEPLRNFILPGGTPAASTIHIARTVCRRAERSVITAASTNNISDDCIKYLNRLSDFLFVLSRYENFKCGVVETTWKSE